MQRAKVCVRSVIVSGENHLRLVKVKDMQTEIDDQEAAYLDNTGTHIIYIYTFTCVCVCVCVFIPGWLRYRACSWQEQSSWPDVVHCQHLLRVSICGEKAVNRSLKGTRLT